MIYEESCEYCRYNLKGEREFPCSECCHNYISKYEKEITNYDKFIEVFGQDPEDIFHNLFDWSNKTYKG